MSSEIDRIGKWSEVKLEIIREYLPPYSKLVTDYNFYHLYIDGFAGYGLHESKATGKVIPGSPMIALNVEPPFRQYHFIDLNPAKISNLRALAKDRDNVFVHEGDCNEVLLKLLPEARFDRRRRALCLLDPYGIDLAWNVVAAAGAMKSVELFINFMVMDMNMNVLLNEPDKARPDQIERMNRFWGDESWREAVHMRQGNLFGDDHAVKLSDSNRRITEAYRRRLMDVAGFQFVPEPLPFANSLGHTIYYLFFASPNKTGDKIVTSIFEKYRKLENL